jgi:hypothetical protein
MLERQQRKGKQGEREREREREKFAIVVLKERHFPLLCDSTAALDRKVL